MKGGKTTNETTMRLPPQIEAAAEGLLQAGGHVSQLGYVPYAGPTIAALDPMQIAAMGNVSDMASAYGMQSAGPRLPAAQTYAGGVQGYSPMQLYKDAVAAIPQGQHDFISGLFMDPITGAAPTDPMAMANVFASLFAPAPGGGGGAAPAPGGGGANRGSGMDRGDHPGFAPATPGGGFTSFRDMFDGGGPGTSGDTFQGGPFSGIGNMLGGPGIFGG